MQELSRDGFDQRHHRRMRENSVRLGHSNLLIFNAD
jgi:hypothetical protein